VVPVCAVGSDRNGMARMLNGPHLVSVRKGQHARVPPLPRNAPERATLLSLNAADGGSVKRVEVNLFAGGPFWAGGRCIGSISAGGYHFLKHLFESLTGLVTL
jgi:hypothetical protein